MINDFERKKEEKHNLQTLLDTFQIDKVKSDLFL